MSKTRNERRKATKQRLMAKTIRIARASLACDADVRRDKTISNLSTARPRADGFKRVRSCLNGLEGKSHRGYVCRA